MPSFLGSAVSPRFAARPRSIDPRTSFVRLVVASALFSAVLGLHPAFAATVTWSSGVGGAWSDGTKWSTNPNPPQPGDDVIIDAGGTYTVTLDVDPSVASVKLGNAGTTLFASGRTLTLTGSGMDIDAGSVADLESGTTVAGAVTNGGTIIARGPANAITGTLVSEPLSIIKVDPEGVNNHAALTVPGFTNHGRIVLDNNLPSNFLESRLTVTGTLVNATDGSIESRNTQLFGGSRFLAAQLDNRGAITVNYPTTVQKDGAAHTMSGGSITVNAGQLTVQQAGPPASSFAQSGGTISAALGANMTVNGGTFAAAGGASAGPGSLIFNDCDVTGLTLGSTSVVELWNGSTVDVVTNGGKLVARGLGNAVTAALTSLAGSNVTVDPEGINSSAGLTVPPFTNHGLIVLDNRHPNNFLESRLTVTGTLLNDTDGSIESRNSQLFGGSRFLAAQLDNRGAVTVNYPTTLQKDGAAHTMISGTITVAAGQLTVQQAGPPPSSFAQSGGTISAALGANMTVNGGTFAALGGASAGPGSLIFNDCDVSGLTLGATSVVELWNGSTVDVVTNGGKLVARGPGNVVTAAYTSLASSNVTVDPEGVNNSAALTVPPFTNHGLIVLDNRHPNNFLESRLTVTGTLVNDTDGSIESRNSQLFGGSRFLAAEIDNRGAITVNFPMTVQKSAAAHKMSSGTITVNAGQLTVQQAGPPVSSFAQSGGTISVSATPGANMTVNGGTFAAAGGASAGPGSLILNDCDVTGLTLGSTSVVELWNGSTVDVVTNGGKLVARGPGNTVTAALTSLAGSNLTVDPEGVNSSSALTVPPFTNHGLVVLDDRHPNNFLESRLTVTGTLLNDTDGSIESRNSQLFGGTRVVAASIDNHGTITVLYPMALQVGPVVNALAGVIRGTSSLDVSGVTFTDNGITQPGTSPGILTITGTDTRGPKAALVTEIGGPGAGTNYDRLVVDGTESIAGRLTIQMINGFVPDFGNRFTVLQAATYTGTFGIISGRLIAPDRWFNVEYLAGKVDLVVVTPPPANNPPNAVDDQAVTDEDVAVDVDVIGNDSDPDQEPIDIVIGSLSSPQHGSAVFNGDGTVHYTPNPDENGTDSFTYRIVDERGAEATGTVHVTINPVPDPPHFTQPTTADDMHYDIVENGTLQFQVCAVDPDDPESVTLTSVDLPTGATMTPDLPTSGDPVCSTFDWDPVVAQKGMDYTFHFHAKDATDREDTMTVIVHVDQATPTLLARLVATPTELGVELSWEIVDRTGQWDIRVERAPLAVGPWQGVVVDRSTRGSSELALDRSAEAGRTYYYRLVANSTSGVHWVSGPVEAGAVFVRELALDSPTPNPAAGAVSVGFAVPRAMPVRITVLDLQGREVARLTDGPLAAGRYQMLWSGDDAGRRAGPGVYFVRMSAPGFYRVRRLVLER